jgi:hypothetical protein
MSLATAVPDDIEDKLIYKEAFIGMVCVHIYM